MTPDILPDSRLSRLKAVVKGWIGPYHTNLVPIFCANCGAPGGMVPEENMTFAFYLCDERAKNCVAKWNHLASTYVMPDEVFWAKVREAQVEKYGRELSVPEQKDLVKDDSSILAKLGKERPNFIAGG